MHDDVTRTIGWDESLRPHITPPADGSTPHGLGSHLVLIHDMFRRQLDAILRTRDLVRTGQADVGELRQAINGMSLRAGYEQFGAFCAQYCRMVSTHHAIEDQHLFPSLQAVDPLLTPVLDRLRDEHVAVHRVLVDLDAAAVTLAIEGSGFDEVDRLVDVLSSGLRSHLQYEEDQLVAPLGQHAIVI